MAQGVLIFNSLADAIREGWQIYDRLRDADGGYLVRKKQANDLWAMALVRFKA